MPDSKGPGVMIVGSGRTGLQTARLLSDRGHDTVIIERNPGRVRELVDQRVATVIEGDATNSDVLRQADLDQADVIVTMTDTMGTNFTVCILATEICPDVRTVMRSVYETTRATQNSWMQCSIPRGLAFRWQQTKSLAAICGRWRT